MTIEFTRSPISRVAMAAIVAGSIVLPYQFASAGAPAAGLGLLPSGSSLVTEVKNKGKNVHVNKNIYNKNIYINKGGKNWYVKSWKHRPYYGSIIAGVALGTLIGVTAAGVAPVAPAPDLCWYWSNPYRNQGYWDYCY